MVKIVVDLFSYGVHYFILYLAFSNAFDIYVNNKLHEIKILSCKYKC